MSLIANILSPLIKYFVGRQGRKRQPVLSGTVSIPGLSAPVEIIRDRYAVPHIYAQNREDLFAAQGYVHAQERLWQMELTRRASQGRLSEMIGADAVHADRICRTLGFARAGERDFNDFKDEPFFAYLKDYVKGVNAYINSYNKKTAPVEFALLKHEVAPWTELDVLTFARFISFQMCFGWTHEVIKMQLAAVVGEDAAAELFVEYPEQNPTAIAKSNETYQLLNDGRLEAFTGPYLRSVGGSNNWTVAASKMQTGAAALANDPHLVLALPNIWYDNHLIAPDFEVTGVSLPGAPMVMIGHNRDIAWGATLSFADVQDVFIEKFTKADLSEYEYDGKTLKAEIKEEKIFVKGKAEPLIEKVVITHHGPIVSGLMDYNGMKHLALKSKALEDSRMILGFFGLNTASNWNTFVDACKDISAPTLNLVYADTKNNIGYYMTGQVPIRKRHQGALPAEGWLKENDWTGNVPFEEMPHAYNPPQGYFYTCNHRIVDDSYPHYISSVWMNGNRARRLDDLFKAKQNYTLDDFAAWQADVFCYPGKEMADLVMANREDILDAIAAAGQSHKGLEYSLAGAAVIKLSEWDGFLTKDSVGGSIYEALKQKLFIHLIHNTITDLDNPALVKDAALWKTTVDSNQLRGAGAYPIALKFSDYLDHLAPMILRLLKNPESFWLQQNGGMVNSLAKAFVSAAIELSTLLGKDMNTWHWGKLHQLTLPHAFGERKALSKLFNRGGYPVPGDCDTLCQMSHYPATPYGGEMTCASWRQIIDMGNLANSRCVMPAGQSGNFASKHYDDQMQMYLNHQYRPMLWLREDIEREQHYKTIAVKA